MPRSSQAASCSGSTASPTSGTNAISPSPAVARIDAAVGDHHDDQDDAEDRGDFAQVPPDEREAPAARPGAR